MRPKRQKRVIDKSLSRRFIFRCVLIFVCGGILAVVLLYHTLYQPLGPSYGASFHALDELRQTMLLKSIYINLFSLLLVCIGIAFFTVLYTHRIVGPMERLKRAIAVVASGDVSTNFVLRDGDVLHSLVDELNKLCGNYREALAVLEGLTTELRQQSNDLRLSVEDRETFIRQLAGIARKAQAIQTKVALLNTDLIE